MLSTFSVGNCGNCGV